MFKYLLTLFRPSLEKRTSSALSLFDKAINKLDKVNFEANEEAESNAQAMNALAERNAALTKMVTGNSNIAQKLKDIVSPTV